MDIRRIQKTGGSSFTVTLPKKWTSELHIQDKDVVRMVITKANTLLIQPLQTKSISIRSTLQLHGLTKNMLIRELIAHYISGVDEIIIKGKKISPEERKTIRNLSNIFIGFELIDESSDQVTIKNIFDQSKFPTSQNLEKMFLITSAMFEDAWKALSEKDLVLAKDVVERDFDVDKLHFAITRKLYANMRNTFIENDEESYEIDLYFYQNIATQLERIADHASKIAKTVSQDDTSGTPISTSANIVKAILTLLQKSKQVTKSFNLPLAHEILDNSMQLEEMIYSRKTRKHKTSHTWDVFEDSLDRIRGYIMNMAELAIDQAVLKSKT